MLFFELIFKLTIMQKKKENAYRYKRFYFEIEKTTFYCIEIKKIIQTFEFDYIFFIIFIYRLFQLYHVYITF